MRLSKKTALFAGTATVVCALAFNSSPAAAECVTNAATVTCTGTTTTAGANAAIAAATPSSVTIRVQPDATIVSPGPVLTANNPPFNGAIDLGNAGTIGTGLARVGFNYFGTQTAATNTLSLTNSGTITGTVFTNNVGGTQTAVNTGTLAGGLTLQGFGDISLTSSGPIYVATGGVGTTALRLDSSGAVSATLTGPIAIPASDTTTAQGQRVTLTSGGNAQLDLNALADAVSVSSARSVTTPAADSGTTVAGGTTTVISGNSTVQRTGSATAIIGSDAQIASLTVQSGAAPASASVAGAVGSATAPGFVTIGSNGLNSQNRTVNTSNATGSTSSSTNVSTPVGGGASLTIAGTGRVVGPVSVSSNAGAASATIAGTVGAGTGANVTTLGDVSVLAQGIAISSQSNGSVTNATGDFTNSSSTSRTATGGAANVTLASTGNVFGSVSATGDSSATIDNAGRIRDNATVFSNRSITTASDNRSSQTTTVADGATTVAQTNASGSTSTQIGGTGTLVNRASAVIEGDVQVSGVGGVTIDNAGASFGNVNVTSNGQTTVSTNDSATTTTTTPAATGGAATRVVNTNTSSSATTPIGGAATGTYSGTVGAIAGSALSGYRSVNQSGQAGSTATIAGTMIADFNASAGATGSTSSSSSTTTSTTQAAVGPATGARELVSTSSTRNATTWVAAPVSVTVTGALRNNGTGTGDLFASTGAGNTAVAVTGGTVEGGITAQAGFGANSISGTDASFRSTAPAKATGPAAASISQSSINTSFSESQRVAGAASVALTGANVLGGVSVSGQGTGAGSTAAALTVSTDSVVGGVANVQAYGNVNQRTDSVTTDTRTGAAATNRIARTTTVSTAPPVTGNATATVAGRAGSLQVYSGFGNATGTLTGQLTTGGANVTTGTTLSGTTTDSSFAGTSTTGFGLVQTGLTQTTRSTPVGGTAALTIAASPALQAAGTSSVNGSIVVGGLAGSSLTIASGTRILATNAGSVVVAFGASNSTSTTNNTYTAGALSGQTITSSTTEVGGPATFTNAGIIGSSTGYSTSPTSVYVASNVGGATATNTGTVFGSLGAAAVGTNTTTSTVSTGLNDPVLTRTTTTTTNTGVGGAAAVTNTGVVSGAVSVAGATGTVTNGGVMRSGISLGQVVPAYTTVQTVSPTSSTLVATAPATRFAQAYTVNQNGLVAGGISVNGATTADFSTGALSTAVLRTSDISATINLNGGSITTGNIIAQTAVPVTTAVPVRLTNTTLRLTGDGYLGVGTTDTPSAALGVGAGTLRFANTPGYAVFIATDPALGSLSGTVFTPNVTLPSGSAVRGVTLVEKSGTGIFTIVGTAYRAANAATPIPAYTMDVGTLRISGGELQLGVAGSDPATGASIFGIRGNVENTGGTLVLGRRVTDGSTAVLQGTNVRIDGSFTQAAGGTTGIAVAPALIRSAGTSVGALPAEGILGFGGYGVGLTPFVAYDPTIANSLRSTPSTLTVSDAVSLAGTLNIAATPGAIYAAGRNADLITVGGAFSQTGLTVQSNLTSPFVKFVLTPRASGTSTIVSLDVQRTSYATATTTSNAAAAATALDGTIGSVVTRLSAIRNPNAVVDVQSYGRLQDLATVIAGLDTQLTLAQASEAFVQLGSGSIYGSILATPTTAPFGEAIDSVGSAEAGIGMWFRPTGRFARYDGSSATGAARLRADNYGGAMGFNITTGAGGNYGIGGGYGRIDARDVGLPSTASADTYMVGAYGAQKVGGFSLAAQAVFGWSNWHAVRALPLFARTANASFDSKEFRIDGRVGYDFDLGNVLVTPFARLEARRYSFAGFEERNAGGIGLSVASHKKTVVSPELGLRVGGDFAGIRPFIEGAYVFQGDVEGYRQVSYLGDGTASFRLQGVDPEGHAKLSAGVSADVYGASLFLRGNYLTGGRVSIGEAQGGIAFRF